MKPANALMKKIVDEHISWLESSKTNAKKDAMEVEKLLRHCHEAKTLNHALAIFGGIPSLTWATQAIVRGMQSESGIESLLALHVEERWVETSHGNPGYPNIQRDALLFLSFQMWDRCSWLFPRLHPSHPSKRYHFPGENWTLSYPLEFFCHCLWAHAEEKIPQDSDVEASGPYSGIFKHWNNPDELVGAISDACDYHLKRAVHPGGYDIHEFDRAPFTLLPVEILALRSVREKRGLPMPEVDHPLLNSALVASLPRTLPEVQDELMDKINAAVKKFHSSPTVASGPLTFGGGDSLGSPPSFSVEEESKRTGLFRRAYKLNVTMRFATGETLDLHWPHLMKAIAGWRRTRGKNASILALTFQSDPALHPSLCQEITCKSQADRDLDAWIESLQDYTLSFQDLDGTDCRDLVWEKQPDGSNLFTEMKYSPLE